MAATVTAIVPARLPAPFLGAALDSLRAQTRPLDEIILLAHGWSPDVSDPMLTGVRVVEVSPELRLYQVRNVGLHEAAGDFAMLLDSDDIAEPERLEQQLAAVERHPDAVVVCSTVELMDDAGQGLGPAFFRAEPVIRPSELIARNRVAHSSVLVNRGAALQVGGYGPVAICEDYELWLRMAALGAFISLPQALTRYRIHAGQMTGGRRVPRRSFAAITAARFGLARSAGVGRGIVLLRDLIWRLVQVLPKDVGPKRFGVRWPKRTHVMLSGGLGNQMFQTAAALDVAHGNPVVLWPDLGAPRRHDGVHADLLRLSLPPQVCVGTPGASGALRWFASKSANYMLRIGVMGSDLECRPWFRWGASRAAALAVWPVIRRRTRIAAAMGIGSDPAATGAPGTEPLLLGYFQTWRHVGAQHVAPALRSALNGIEDAWFEQMRELAEVERPIIVHVRLGDYRKEPALGIIEPAYYAAAIEAALAAHPHSRLWLFSDEPEAALAVLPADVPAPRIVDPPTPSTHPAALMRVMTLGRAYVLANSTFGWWAAMLAVDVAGTVTVPDPWFVIGKQPRDLIPASWARRSRHTGLEVAG